VTRHLVDIGIGRLGAAVGTEPWALELRLQITGLVKDIPEKPERLSRYMALFIEHRGWALVHDKYGDKFRSFDAFCECPQPYGLGQPWRDVRRQLAVLLGEKAVGFGSFTEKADSAASLNIATAPIDGRGLRELTQPRDEKGRLGPSTASGNDCPIRDDRSAKMYRAIAERTPEPARNLYRAGLLGVVEAAKLGPKNPSPDEAARVTEVARELVAVAESVKGEPKPKAKRIVTAKARELLGVRRDRVGEALRIVEAMSDEDRDAFKEALVKRWPCTFNRRNDTC